jgi:hypothetical protein
MSSIDQHAAGPGQDRPTVPRMRFRFTPDVYDQVEKLAKAGWNGREIADRLGCSYPSLRVLCQRAKISLESGGTLPSLTNPGSQREPVFSTDDEILPVWLCSAAVERLVAEARHRATSPDRLAAHILRAVVSSQLFDAILD